MATMERIKGEVRTNDAQRVVEEVLAWARTPGNHGGNPYTKDFVQSAERAAETAGYNGWNNYETWAMALWIDNEQGSYDYSRELVNKAAEEAATADPERSMAGAGADALKEWQEDLMPELDASVWSDLLRAAFGAVDWYEIAENYLSE